MILLFNIMLFSFSIFLDYINYVMLVVFVVHFCEVG
jgi:hypothetical protein